MDFANYWFSSGAGGAGYEIEQSLRFDGAASLTRTQATPTNGNIVTVSAWIKLSSMTATDPQGWMGADAGTSTSGAELKFASSANGNKIELYNELTNGSRGVYFESHARYRDPSAWMHVVSVYQNSSTPADSPTYVNGVQITGTSGSAGSNPGAGWGDAAPQWNMSGVIQSVGSCTTTAYRLRYLYGYLAEVIQVDGQALDQYDFGEFDDNGVWRPIEYTGTYGNNGFYLKFDPSATNGVGHDHSGNGNHFTPSGITVSGTGTDVMDDTPTTNWCTFNPVYVSQNNSGNQFSEGNLKYVSSGTAWRTNVPTFGSISSGKWYWEWSVNTIDAYCGIIGEDVDTIGSGNTQSQAGTILYYASGQKRIDNVGSSYGSSYNGGGSDWDPVVGIALDKDNNTITFYRNGVSQGAINLSSSSVDLVNKPVRPAFLIYDGTSYGNFGQFAFQHTPPSGFLPLNTSNLPAPDIADGSQYFNTVLWTGTGGTRTVTGYGFQPDFAWIKSRSTATDNTLVDVLRSNYRLRSNTTEAELTTNDGFVSFASDGLNLDGSGSGGDVNTSGRTFVGWAWDAGGTGSSIAAGSIDGTNPTIASTVSANPTAGFSIVSYTAQNAVRTIGHGLGVVPGLIIVKNRDATQNWAVYHKSLGATKALYLDLDIKQDPGSGYWNNTEPTSTVFTVGTNTRTGGTTNKYVAYCFAEIEGYSKFSTYRGNGNTDGAYCYTGFKPAWVMVKTYAGGSQDSWYIWDNKSDPYNFSYHYLRADATSAQNTDTTNAQIDILSNGFKIRQSSANINENGSDYVFIAFAEHPFGGSGVSPATAR